MPSSIRELARKTGLSTATVSMALSGKGRVAPKTREKVREAALALGYQAHPLLSQALSLARLPEPSRYRETIAFLVEYAIDTVADYHSKTYEGARTRAREMGYKVEAFQVSSKPSEQRRLSRILRARGIRGLIIIARLGFRQPRLDFEWEHFASVEIGRTLWHPRDLHHIETDGYNKMIEAIHLLKKVGYHRIGMAVEPDHNKHQRGSHNAAYLVMQLRLPVREHIPPISSYGPWNEKVFRRWMEQYRPDVIIIHDSVTVYSWLNNMGLKVPRDISLFCSDLGAGGPKENKDLSGLRRNYTGMGRSAVEMISILLQEGKLGLAEDPRCWLVDEFWRVGKTLSHSIAAHVSEKGFLLADSRYGSKA